MKTIMFSDVSPSRELYYKILPSSRQRRQKTLLFSDVSTSCAEHSALTVHPNLNLSPTPNYITKYTIYGERCSGTNYLQNIIQLNYDAQIVWEYG